MFFVALVLGLSTAAGPMRPECVATDKMRAEALTLSWSDFDQKQDSPAGMRKLSTAGCFKEAAELQEFYIANHKGLTAKEIANSKFHIGQNYASAGLPDRALLFIRQSLDPNQPADTTFDWNTYVLGVIAFLEQDRDALLQKMSVLRASPDRGNQINGRVLARMNKCFAKPYRDLWTPDCESP